ncbi:MAK10-like protein [Tanacetum coccineum]
MGDENPIRTLGHYFKPSHKGYRNTIELPVGNNVVHLRSDTIRLVQNECSFHGLRSEDPNQHLKDFLKLVDSLDLDSDNRERTRLRLFQFSLRDQASNWLERLLAGSITTWEDLTTRFLAQFFLPRRTVKLRNDILMFQQCHGESLSEAWTRFKYLLQKVPHHGIDLWLQALLEDLALYDNESWNDPRDFAKPVKAIVLPQDVLSTFDRRLIELENQVQRLMEAHLAPTQPTQVNKITTSCEICSGPTTLNIAWKIPNKPLFNTRPRLPMKQEVSGIPSSLSKTTLVTPTIRHGKVTRTLEGLVSEFMASQDARLSKFEADFKRQQAITDQIAGTLPSDTVKNPKLETRPVLSARSYPTKDPQCSTYIHSLINAITIHPKQPEEPQDNEPDVGQEEKGNLGNINSNPHLQPDPLASIATEQVRNLNLMLESLGLIPQSSNTKFVCTKEDDGEVMFIETIRDDDETQNESPNEGEGTTTEGPTVKYFDTFPTRD